MSVELDYYEISSLTKSAESLFRETRDSVRRNWLCPGCMGVKPKIQAVDLRLQTKPTNVAMTFAWGTGFGIIHRDLLEILGEPAKTDLMLGGIYGADGERYPEFSSFRGRVRIVIRGDATSTYWRCQVCGRYRYSPFGKRYVLTGALTGASIFESQHHSLIVGGETIRRVKQRKWKELGIAKVLVLDSPEDKKPIFYSEEDGCFDGSDDE